MADSKIFPHSYNTLIGFDFADEQMNLLKIYGHRVKEQNTTI